MMRYFVLEPEVAGGLGKETVLDSNVHPPRIYSLHYELEGWLGDDILETFPCFLVTERLRVAMEGLRLSGYVLAPVDVTVSDVFRQLYPDRLIPQLHWLRIEGRAGDDDFGLSKDLRLVVSDRVLQLLKSLTLEHCEIETWAE